MSDWSLEYWAGDRLEDWGRQVDQEDSSGREQVGEGRQLVEGDAPVDDIKELGLMGAE